MPEEQTVETVSQDTPADGQFEFQSVSQDQGFVNPEEPNAQTAEPQQAQQQAQDQPAQDQQQAPEQQPSAQTADESIASEFFVKDGQFDQAGFNDYLGKASYPTYQSPAFGGTTPPEGYNPASEGEAEDPFDALEKELTETEQSIINHYDNFEKNVVEFAQTNPNATFRQAIQYAKDQAHRDVQRHMVRERNQRYSRLNKDLVEKDRSEFRTKEQLAQTKERAQTNVHRIADKYGGVENFGKALWNQKIGFPVIQMLFDVKNGGGEKYYGNGYTEKLEQFANDLFANPSHAEMLGNIVHALVVRSHYGATVRRGIQNQQTTAAQATRATGQRPAQQASSPQRGMAGGGFGTWLNAPPKMDSF